MKKLQFLLISMVVFGCSTHQKIGPELQGTNIKKQEAVAGGEGTLSFEGIKDNLALGTSEKISGRVKVKGAPEGKINNVYLFLNRNLIQKIEVEGEAKFQVSGEFLKGPNVLSAVLVRGDGSVLENISARDQILFNVNDPTALPPESSARLAKNEGFLLVAPVGTFTQDQALKIPLRFVNLEAQQTEMEVFRYSLNGETRQIQGRGPFSFNNLPPGRYQLKVWRVDKKGNALEGSYFYTAENEFVVAP